MKCQYCQEDFAVKDRNVAVKCLCDEDKRFFSFEEIYFILFNLDWYKT